MAAAHCPICFEPWDAADCRPLLLACCRGGSVCEACIVKQLELGWSKCFYCPKRPNPRLFVASCETATPADHLESLLAKSLGEDEDAQRAARPKAAELGTGVLAAELLSLSEMPGDAQLARELQAQLEEEDRKERRWTGPPPAQPRPPSQSASGGGKRAGSSGSLGKSSAAGPKSRDIREAFKFAGAGAGAGAASTSEPPFHLQQHPAKKLRTGSSEIIDLT